MLGGQGLNELLRLGWDFKVTENRLIPANFRNICDSELYFEEVNGACTQFLVKLSYSTTCFQGYNPAQWDYRVGDLHHSTR
jgi:hypothetical protein